MAYRLTINLIYREALIGSMPGPSRQLKPKGDKV